MTVHSPRRTLTVLAAVTVVAVLIAGCSGHSTQNDPTVSAPPSSTDTATEQAAVVSWLLATNQMWTKHNFTATDEVTTGSMRIIYQYEQHDAGGSGSHKKLTLTDLSITLPCQNTSPSIFVAYARTNVFTLGQGTQSAAMVFQHDSTGWMLAAAVTHFDGSRWPALCQDGIPAGGAGELSVTDYAPTLAGVLTRAAGGTTPTAAQAQPFAVNSFLSGSGSIPDQTAADRGKDHAAGDQYSQTFTTSTDSTFALPLANNAGYWLIGTLQQQNQLDSSAGITTKTWPDGTDVDTPHPATVHHQTDEFLDTYTATEPAQPASGQINLDGFFGSPILATAS